ncbi:MAG: Ig-like domain-containing protein, partial [Candidatus Micrarchaeia archaeon]
MLEYMLTYSWALLIVAIIIAILYLFIYVPSVVVPAKCTMSFGAYCQDLVFGSNTVSSTVAIMLTNTQSYPIINPSLYMNVSNIGQITGTCKPNFVAPGGAIICSVSIPQRAISSGTFVSGDLYLQATPCPSGNAASCASQPKQTYKGNFNTHVSPLLTSTTIDVSLNAASLSEAASGVGDKLTATVRMLGYPITGATVNFTANQSFVSIKPNPTTTDSNGNAFSYASSTQTGNVKITATFAGSSANVIINFTPPVYVTFETTPMQSTTAPVLTVDGVSYTYQQLPLTIAYNINSKHSYSFASPISGATSTRYAYSSISGCGVSTQSGNFTAISNCTMLATYKTQYYLNMQANPNTAGTVSPASNWFDASKIVGISAASSSMYFFKNWTGIGIGNYSGKAITSTVTMGGPITEIANFFSTTSTTSTSTSTSTSTTSTSTSTSTSTTSTSTSTSTSTTSTSTSTSTTSTSTSTSTTSTSTTSTSTSTSTTSSSTSTTFTTTSTTSTSTSTSTTSSSTSTT